jgi:hypothetical protein
LPASQPGAHGVAFICCFSHLTACFPNTRKSISPCFGFPGQDLHGSDGASRRC